MNQFDRQLAIKAKWTGLNQTQGRRMTWFDHAMAAAAVWAVENKHRCVLGEEIRKVITESCGEPSSPHVWGALTMKLIAAKVIEPTGTFRSPTGVKSHNSKKQVHRVL